MGMKQHQQRKWIIVIDQYKVLDCLLFFPTSRFVVLDQHKHRNYRLVKSIRKLFSAIFSIYLFMQIMSALNLIMFEL